MEYPRRKRSRSRSHSPPPWRRGPKSPRSNHDQSTAYIEYLQGSGRGRGRGGHRGSFQTQQQRRNQEQEDRQMRAWMSHEDDFVLKQSKKKARIRIKEGRAKPIDRLVLISSLLDPVNDPLEEELDDVDLEIRDPSLLLETLSPIELTDLESEIDHYLVLEHTEVIQTFWQASKAMCQYKAQAAYPNTNRKGIASVSADVDRLLGPKSLEQLQSLESQVHQKLRADEVIDEEYWEQLLESIKLYKAKAHLGDFFSRVNAIRLNEFRKEQIDAALRIQAVLTNASAGKTNDVSQFVPTSTTEPESLLRLRPEDQGLEVVEEGEFTSRIQRARDKVIRTGYVNGIGQTSKRATTARARAVAETSKNQESHSSATHVMYDNEAARGFEEDEEVFGNDDEVNIMTNSKESGNNGHRKPKHFNRVQMGYEWNKYNQTHYDHDNPPPKVVQGYKFNIFYPDLIDKTKAPTYRIERENGRKKGQSLAPAGEEDTCIIHFISGAPYDDIAFRIVDREWDYSSKRERGFKSSFDNGVLQLHFQFKKIYYRK